MHKTLKTAYLEQVYLYCVDKKVITNNECSLCYDGLMILKENYYPELLDELEELIFYQFGLRFKFEQKKHDKLFRYIR